MNLLLFEADNGVYNGCFDGLSSDAENRNGQNDGDWKSEKTNSQANAIDESLEPLIAEIIGPKGKVFTTETIKDLVEFAKKNLKKAKINNVKVIHTDGSKGWPTAAPYDRIICTAAAPKIPEVYIEQLKEGGIIVIPVGPLYGQVMVKGIKKKGKLETQRLGDFMFVPLTGKFGQ